MVDEGIDAGFAVGQVVGSYRIIRRLGAGGMGCVYEVEHTHLGVRYALKALTVGIGQGDEFRRRFDVEGRILARLSHPNLVRVIDLDIDGPTGTPYFVMDLVLGADGNPHTLGEIGADGIEEDRLRGWFAELCSALDYIHAQGIVHRDIKLENILLSHDGHVMLSDFGISRITDDGLRRRMDLVTTIATGISGRSAFVMGTRGYMAPEVLRGEPASPAADVYSFGVAFFRLLTNLWYEPAIGSADAGSGHDPMNVMKLLRFFEYDWSAVLPSMLSNDPKLRPSLLLDLPARLNAVRKHSFRWRSVAALLGGVIALVGVVYCVTRMGTSDAEAARDAEFAEAFGFASPGEKSQ